ncbi:MAG: hypothetical protein ABI430_03445 [Candidatus Taylorbacteria bacterium]
MPPQKSKLKIVIIAILILVIIGFIAYYFFFGRNKGSVSVVPANDSQVTFTIGNQDIGINQGTGVSTSTSANTSSGQTIVTGSGIIPKLRKISANPVAGAIAKKIVVDTKVSTIVRYIERATGNVYETDTNSWNLKRISNTTIPKIVEAIWGKDANSLYIRRILDGTEDIETYYARLRPGTTTKILSLGATEEEVVNPDSLMTLEGVYLPRNIEELSINNAGNKLFYFTEKVGRGVGVVSDVNGLKGVEVFNSPLSDFQISWPKEDTLTFTTRPSGVEDGFFYFGNSGGAKLQKLFGNILGLTTLTSPNAQMVLLGESSGNGYNLGLFDVKKKTREPLSLNTLPEKCVWSALNLSLIYCAVPSVLPLALYPDSWYQGLVSFSDEIWRINTETGENKLIAKPKDLSGGDEVDATKLFLDPDENYLFFTNKKNSSFWSLKLSESVATTSATE